MDKLIITAAICGAEVTKKHLEAIPYTIDELVREAASAYNAGASIIHLHVREDDGTPTQSKKRFKMAMDAINEKCPGVIIQPSTGGAVGMSIDERLEVLELNPEMATLDCGTLNFGGDDIFVNTENDIIEFNRRFNERQIKPELECFDKGHIDLVLRLFKKGIIKGPMHFDFVLGVNGGMSGEIRDFTFLKESIPMDATYTVAGIGKYEFPLATYSILNGGHVRVGFEDNIYIKKGQLAKSNGELVEKIVKLAELLGRDIATPQEAREILNIKR